MIYQKETLNKIATMRYCGKSVEFIAAALGLVVADVAAALKAFKLCYRDWETDRKSTRLNSSHRL